METVIMERWKSFMKQTCAIILAAGKGTRMKSNQPKVLAQVLFKPMLGYVIDSCKHSQITDICVVTGHQSEMVEQYLDGLEGNFTIVKQEQQKGTGHAVICAKEFIESHRGQDVLVLYGDTPCLDNQTILEAHQLHQQQQNAITVVSAVIEDPTGYGRVIRNGETVEKIVEQRDASLQQLEIQEINAGVYWFAADKLLCALQALTSNNAQGEYYLPDTIAITQQQGNRVGCYRALCSDIIRGANSRRELYQLNEFMRQKVIDKHLDQGVEFVSIDGVYIAPDAVIGTDTVILPGTILKEQVVIGEHCSIGPNTLIQRSTVGNRVTLNCVQCYQSKIHDDVDIGPFVHIRPNSEIHHHVHIGDFVEVKNSVIGAGTGISHLTYVGDSDVGKNVNFGCGVVTVNYDGVHKHRCTIKDGAFIGCNTNLVAPVTIGENGYTGAGSTITEDVPAQALGIARARQQIKEEFSTKKLAGRKKKV